MKTDFQSPGIAAFPGACKILHVLEFCKNTSSRGDKLFANGGQPRAARHSFEQANSEPRLDLLNAFAQCRLRDVQSSRGAAKASVIRNCDRITQRPKIDHLRRFSYDATTLMQFPKIAALLVARRF
jgi:hypothetical protein